MKPNALQTWSPRNFGEAVGKRPDIHRRSINISELHKISDFTGAPPLAKGE